MSSMQQYFIEENLKDKLSFTLDDEIYHHLYHVLRSNNDTLFRIVDNGGSLFLCRLDGKRGIIVKELEEKRELPIEVTVILSLIKNERFDFCLQKLTELGIKRIIPYQAKRSIIKIKDEESKLRRYRKICKEAAEQSLRTFIPDIPEIIDLSKISQYKSTFNYLAYEKNDSNYIHYQKLHGSLTYVIGPEGGFEEDEAMAFIKNGFEAVSLGRRILRAETAALYVMANIGGVFEG